MLFLRALTCSLILTVLDTAYSLNEPPKIEDPTQPMTKNEIEGAEVVLKCNAVGTPTPKYRWRKDGKEVNTQYITVDKDTGDLTINSFSEREEGFYQCLAENLISDNNRAVAMSSVIHVQKAGLDQEWPESNMTEFTAQEGQYLKLTCDNQPRSVPKAVYSWYIVQGIQTDGEVTVGERIYIDNEGSLHFIYLEESDQTHNKQYKCGMYNSYDSVIKLGSAKRVAVIAHTPLPQVGADHQFNTNPAKFLISENAELECIFSGNPIPTITWKNGEKEIITNSEKYSISDNGRKLTINKIVEEDEQGYECVGSNPKGKDDAYIFLDVTSGPIWIESLSSQTVSEGKDARFPCRARPARGDNELGPPKWFRNGSPLPVQNTEKFEFSDNARVLTVKNLSKLTDIMCLQCNISNSIGYEFGDGCLNVIEPIVVTVHPKLEQTVNKGDIVNLTVLGKTDPEIKLMYRWYFDGKKYESESPPYVTYNTTTKVAYINTSALTEEEYRSINGTYYRDLYHEKGENLTVAIRVYLADVPDAGPAVVAAAADLWWIALVVAIIILIIVVILIICICNRMRQEGTYPLDKKERANDLDPEKDLQDSGFHDLSRAPGDDEFPGKKSSSINPNIDYGDDMDMGDDDESLMEYGGGDFDTSKFNEEGSFIGQYSSKIQTPDVKHSPRPANNNSNESTI